MDLALLLQPSAMPQVAAVLGMLALAAALLYLNFNHRANRIFALFLIVRALSMGTATFRELSLDAGNVAESLYWARIFPYFVIPIPFILAAFALTYPRALGSPAQRRLALGGLVAGAAGLMALYALDRSLWASFDLAQGRLALVAGGPLSVMLGTMLLGYAALAFVFARAFVRAEPGHRRSSVLLVSLAFTFNALFDQTGVVVFYGILGNAYRPVFNLVLIELGFALVALTLVQLAMFARRSGDPEVRTLVRRYLLLAPLPALSALSLFVAPLQLAGLVLTGLWRLALPVLGTYSLLRLQLFDIDVKVRWTIKQGTVAGIFIALFFVVSETAEELFASTLGPLLGLAAAGLLALALHPVQRFAESVAHAAMAGVQPVGQRSFPERAALYQEAVRSAASQGHLTPESRRFLEVARGHLALASEEALRLEHEVLGQRPAATA